MARRSRPKEPRAPKVDTEKLVEAIQWQVDEERILTLRWYLLGHDLLRVMRMPIMYGWAVAQHSPVLNAEYPPASP